ncbi:hypothetical protein BaRGS_00031064 [Batillaria attramentaria]|uniref:Uncharacterized protein n=1 Tax=Batillaria attramentaria TaxID=370345 RepID=A0ABD0JRK2_9CAEN
MLQTVASTDQTFVYLPRSMGLNMEQTVHPSWSQSPLEIRSRPNSHHHETAIEDKTMSSPAQSGPFKGENVSFRGDDLEQFWRGRSESMAGGHQILFSRDRLTTISVFHSIYLFLPSGTFKTTTPIDLRLWVATSGRKTCF